MAQLISGRAYARRRGISETNVRKAIRAGRIQTVGGKIDPDVADREWEANTDPSKPGDKLMRARKNGRPTPPSATRSYAQSRAAREEYQAELARLKLEEQRGILVRSDEVRVAVFNLARKARDQLIALPERVALILAATTEPAEVQRILEEEIERICQELSG